MTNRKIMTINDIPNLSDLGNTVPAVYTYYKKIVSSGQPLNLPGACLKWYDLYPPEAEITEEQALAAKEFIESEVKAGQLKLEGELGFVILHRAGDYLLLLITTWRNTNEMWESVYAKKAGDTEDYIRIISKDAHIATYCVWELGAVWYERNAWVRFIESKRDEETKLAYINDLFEGTV
jgi:hypothetical protein